MDISKYSVYVLLMLGLLTWPGHGGRKRQHRQRLRQSKTVVNADNDNDDMDVSPSQDGDSHSGDTSTSTTRSGRRRTTLPPPLVHVNPIAQISESVEHPKPGDLQYGCKELRSKKYISDGFCTSIRPVTEVICTGHCLPVQQLPWYAEFVKVWSRIKTLEYRCVEDEKRRRRVRLMCENGEIRVYQIKIVKSCKCKRYVREHNRSKLRSRRHNDDADDVDYEADDDVSLE
ncbi:sclerostin [Lingula anatina]|uniref:Sclerostin n=1 Tax=Lingula anatina TaxID=7574 RepID=A0A1S3J5G0_LINAN|nr:sclerostin [Lingula anatina]|eukprot:XP_013405543.1 sclerostin [Lingula anatina]